MLPERAQRPSGEKRTEAARKGLTGIRAFLRAQPPTSLHQKAMLLWAGVHVEGVSNAEEKTAFVTGLQSAQRPDGGWSLASLVENPEDPLRQTEAGRKARAENGHGDAFLVYVGRDEVYKSSLASDGYATGLVVYVLRQAGVPAGDHRVRRGVAWLKGHQRQSGRWFTPSQGWHTQHLIANAGTAFAVLALHACGEVPGPRPQTEAPPSSR
jgi:squalene-hopene/tetraprenyl-beta-curcumene cyclase